MTKQNTRSSDSVALE